MALLNPSSRRRYGRVRLLWAVHRRLRPPTFPTRSLQNSARAAQRYPGSVQEASVHAGFYDDAGPAHVSLSRHGPYCRLQDGKHRRPKVDLRRSMAGLRNPLSTLRFAPHGSPRMTRGRCGSLRLHRRGLSPHTSCRSPGAPVHPITVTATSGVNQPSCVYWLPNNNPKTPPGPWKR